jgi:uncharacterized repeat protein (TIGR03803 family)
MTKLNGWKIAWAAFLIFLTISTGARGQSFTDLLNFDGRDGAEPYLGPLIQGADGAFYGTTEIGGNALACAKVGCGTLFRITATDEFERLSLPSTNTLPESGLILATDGSFYGTTEYGGTGSCDNTEFPGCGTIIKVSPTGKLTTIYQFCSQTRCPDGASPFAPLMEGADGSLYGTTFVGGTGGRGAAFKLTLAGTLTTLYSFCTQTSCADGANPSAGLVQGSDGSFYGTTLEGGNKTCDCGIIFRIAPNGKFTIVYRFEKPNGAAPNGLTFGNDGNLYGTTYVGGDLNCGPRSSGCGTLFRMTPSGELTTLYDFESANAGPTGTLALGSDGNLYGTTGGIVNGKLLNDGTIFEIDTAGTLTTLYTFNDTAGYDPSAGLLQATSGEFYGTTLYGGDLTCNGHSGCGTIFSLDTGLAPFIALVQATGKIGGTAQILGQGFEGTTTVSFNGTSANFTVVSDTYITATVPPSATTGYVTVTTPSGVLTSNVPFHVIP